MRNRAITTIGVLLTAARWPCLAAPAARKQRRQQERRAGRRQQDQHAHDYKIGFIGALSGPNAQLGINERQGAQLAIEQANATGNDKFKIQLVTSDSQGDPAKAPAAATALPPTRR